MNEVSQARAFWCGIPRPAYREKATHKNARQSTIIGNRSGAQRLDYADGPLHVVLGELDLDATDGRAKVPSHPHSRLVGNEGAYAFGFEMTANDACLDWCTERACGYQSFRHQRFPRWHDVTGHRVAASNAST